MLKKYKLLKKELDRFLKKHIGRSVKFLLFAFFLFLIPSSAPFFQKVVPAQGFFMGKQVTLPPAPDYPVNTGDQVAPVLSARAVLIKDIDSGVVLYGKNEYQRFPPASTTKIMTALVALDNYKLDEVVSIPDTTSLDGRIMNLIEGERMDVESLLYGALVHSANDAAYSLAAHDSTGVLGFVEKMNQKAKDLSLSDTHFTNPIGYDDENHYSTATDLAKQALVALKNPLVTRIVGTKAITVSDVTFTYFHDLKNVNELLGKIPGVMGVKTGFTESGGEILISEVKQNNRAVLFVVLKSADRFGETAKLIDWVYSNFEWKKVSEVLPN